MPIEENWWRHYPCDFYDKKVFILREQNSIIQIRKTFFILRMDGFPTTMYFPFLYNDYPLKIINN